MGQRRGRPPFCSPPRLCVEGGTPRLSPATPRHRGDGKCPSGNLRDVTFRTCARTTVMGMRRGRTSTGNCGAPCPTGRAACGDWCKRSGQEGPVLWPGGVIRQRRPRWGRPRVAVVGPDWSMGGSFPTSSSGCGPDTVWATADTLPATSGWRATSTHRGENRR